MLPKSTTQEKLKKKNNKQLDSVINTVVNSGENYTQGVQKMMQPMKNGW